MGLAYKLIVLASMYDLSVTSWYRTPKRNKLVGGSPNSRHLKGRAFDIVLDDDEKKVDFYKDCIKLNIEAIDEGDHLHLQEI